MLSLSLFFFRIRFPLFLDELNNHNFGTPLLIMISYINSNYLWLITPIKNNCFRNQLITFMFLFTEDLEVGMIWGESEIGFIPLIEKEIAGVCFFLFLHWENYNKNNLLFSNYRLNSLIFFFKLGFFIWLDIFRNMVLIKFRIYDRFFVSPANTSE